MKDKKIIAYKKECTKRIAYNLRKLLTRVVMDEWSRLSDEQDGKSTLEHIRIGNIRNDLYRTLHASVCICPSCHQIERDLLYNAYLRG